MFAVNVLKFGTSSPADVTPLRQLQKAGYRTDQVLALAGKTEGNGCVNDFSRTLSATVWEPLLPESAVTVFSGGTEGVLGPHLTFIIKDDSLAGTSALRASVGRTRLLEPVEIGTVEHAKQVMTTVQQMVEEAGVGIDSVHLVLIKCPLLTSEKISAIRRAGHIPITTDTYDSMAKSRYASAVGIAAALGEISVDQMDAAINGNSTEDHIWSAKASCSSGAELEDNHILLLASSPQCEGGLRIVSGYMKDAIDAKALLDCLETVRKENGEVIQVFAKAEADPSGVIRGNRHTMNVDSDIQSTRHARAAVGGLIAGITGDTQVYVSGGAEGQGPPGGGSLSVIYRC
ncbi:ring-opening amidohydrolase [Thozetella sp. PMI_491]|nr:ring-opening amidohydrolase [Thozetella sp. PMI_491]